jgi:hypothetical protein
MPKIETIYIAYDHETKRFYAWSSDKSYRIGCIAKIAYYGALAIEARHIEGTVAWWLKQGRQCKWVHNYNDPMYRLMHRDPVTPEVICSDIHYYTLTL